MSNRLHTYYVSLRHRTRRWPGSCAGPLTVLVLLSVIAGRLAAPYFTPGPAGELTASDGRQRGNFGSSLAVTPDGSTALVGAEGEEDRAGAAYVFVRQGGGWSQQAELTAPNPGPDRNGFFGGAVALAADGRTALVGAFWQNDGRGAVYVFVRHGSVWSRQAELTAPHAGPVDAFGRSVALGPDGTMALVGAPGRNMHTGGAYVFMRHGATWRLQAELTARASRTVDDFGASVALGQAGATALVGATGGRGAAYVFVRHGAAWRQQAELTGMDTGGDFGHAVALASDGATALVGDDWGNNLAGAVYIFARHGRAWTQQAELTAPKAGPEPHDVFGNQDVFGFAVALAADGSTALVGAWGHNKDTGAVYVYVRHGASWRLAAQLTAPDGRHEDTFGHAVALTSSASAALVGADSKGAVYVFTHRGTTWR